jgi:hypothetical protein
MADRLDRLYELLPAVHRTRDVEQGEPLHALLRVIAGQVNVVEDDIAGLYENWFIETCEDWVVPYIGQLVGYQPAVDPGLSTDNLTPSGRARARAIFPRMDVANTVRNRRRKGTLAILEEIAQDSASWPARAIEFFRSLAWSQNVSYTHLHRGQMVDVRNGDALDLLNTPFDSIAHTGNVRRIASTRRRGRHNIPSVGVFVWRLKSYSVTNTKAHCLDGMGSIAYTFSVLGNNAPLFNNPLPESSDTAVAGELNLPGHIRRRALDKHPKQYVSNSFSFTAPNWQRPGSHVKIVSADLSDWKAYRLLRNMVAVDPVLGRLLFPAEQPPKDGVWVSYHYGFSADMGGGEYKRTLSEPVGPDPKTPATVYQIGSGKYKTIQSALDAWTKDAPKVAVIEFTESGVFTEQLQIQIPAAASLELRAASQVRPVLRLLDWQTDQPDALGIEGAEGSRATLDGLIVVGRAVKVSGKLARFTLRHSTLVPGWNLQNDCVPMHPSDPSLEIESSTVAVNIEHSIVGTILVSLPPPDNYNPPAAAEKADTLRCGGFHADPLCFNVSDSILDATSVDGKAFGAPECSVAHVCLKIQRTTVFGQVQVHALELAEDSIFTGQVFVARRQIGCVRFCYVAPGSRTPRQYECQPPAGQSNPAPVFNSTRYGAPDYAQLSLRCPKAISAGASDQSEMGAFHDLYQPQRTALLRARLDESVPAGMEAGIIFET